MQATSKALSLPEAICRDADILSYGASMMALALEMVLAR
jgi:hypothetical protein